MPRISLFAALALIASTIPPAAAADVGVSIHVGDPSFYGRIDIGDVPPPRVIYTRPVIVETQTVRVVEQPLYLRVPPGHAKKWRHYCGRYDACGRQVYFVQDSWYRDTYVPHYRRQHGHPGDEDKHRGKSKKHEGKHKHGHGHGHGHDRHHD
ncbi:hypothetical protein FNU76_03375 [Chitinimonas arctica]|uniref:DUF3300 domain-containing protein n=1 Tax=Chitinimonas arctica TaxID=2594795 RepID=A0A516SBE5_9NEIS|nr:hypothetical protein [Chitinimonas arctica]QDQ25472.1 hypothetical protein FNU76_03375 [Chitinimonas arctica]